MSLDQQADRLAAACHAKGWTLVEIVRDEGWSAKDTHRPGLQRILSGARAPGRPFDTVMVVKIDRLTRSVRDLNDLMESFGRLRLGFMSIDESVDTKSATGRLFLNIIGAVSQWERETIGERTSQGLVQLRKQGRRFSRHAPFGYRYERGKMVPEPREQAVLTFARGLPTGLPRAQLRRALLDAGHAPRSGVWTPQRLDSLIARA